MSGRSLIDTYLVAGQFRVEGWLDPYSADFVRAIADIQRRAGLGGAVGEIGVHHGKLFLVLTLTRAPGEGAFAIDVFEDQKQNLDGSGMGDRVAFERNLRYWGEGTNDIRLIPASSLSLQPDDILRPCGRVRLASIDGGHTAECVRNDLALIEATLTDDGVVVLDDYFNPEWPGVSTGVAEYLLRGEGALCPFAISPNKVFFCFPPRAAFYRSMIASFGGFNRSKSSVLFGSDVDVYAGPPVPPALAVYVKEKLRRSRLAPGLFVVKEWLRSGRRARRGSRDI